MTITLELPPELEARIVAEAHDKGVPVAEIVKSYLVLEHTPVPHLIRLSSEERVAALDELFDTVSVPAGVQEGAFHRENWYR
jgi:hypothetical protein